MKVREQLGTNTEQKLLEMKNKLPTIKTEMIN